MNEGFQVDSGLLTGTHVAQMQEHVAALFMALQDDNEQADMQDRFSTQLLLEAKAVGLATVPEYTVKKGPMWATISEKMRKWLVCGESRNGRYFFLFFFFFLLFTAL